MNKTLISLCTASLLATFSHATLAERDTGKSREQVKAELAEARLNGALPVGEDGLTPRQRHPQLYPSQTRLAASKDKNSAAR